MALDYQHLGGCVDNTNIFNAKSTEDDMKSELQARDDINGMVKT